MEYAQFLHDGSEVLMEEGDNLVYKDGKMQNEKVLVLNLPAVKPDQIVPVIELFLK